MVRALNLCLILPSAGVRFWHAALAVALRGQGHSLAIRSKQGCGGAVRPAGLDLLFELERYAYNVGVQHPSADMPLARVAGLLKIAGEPPFDMTLDLTGVDSPFIQPLFDGVPDDSGLVNALLEGRAPLIEVRLRGKILARGLPAIEQKHLITQGMDCVFVRTIDLMVQAVRDFATGAPAQLMAREVLPASRHMPLLFGVKHVAAKIAARLTRLAGRSDHWRVAWRFTRNDGVHETRVWPQGGYINLPDDARRYYADPFVFVHQGVVHVFVEEYPYATHKGVLSVFTIAADGTMSQPRVILEAPCHLSYPHVFERDGQIWMIPETSGARTVELWRAERFPDQWVREAVLLDDVCLGDATLTEHEGRLWLFAASGGDGGSSWDSLHLYHADHLLGPWTAHARNPVLIDASAARPAGAMWQRDGALFRVVQDCTEIYGGGLSITRVDALTPEVFSQSVETRLAPPKGSGMAGVHTLNRSQSVEVIDMVGWRRGAR